MTREHLTVTCNTGLEVVEATAALVGRYGGVTFELAYTAADRELEDEEEVRDDEPVKWTATAVVVRRNRGRKPIRTTYVGTSIVQPGENHGTKGAPRACVDLLEQLGANVILVDLSDTTDPRV